MKVPFVDLKAQYNSIKPEVDKTIAEMIEKTSFVGGPAVMDFESKFAAFVGIKHCIGCGNGTDALEIILTALGIGESDEVLVPANSWISTSEVVSTVGAKPVFVDVLPERYTMDPDHAKGLINTNTRAIIPVHLYGLPAEMDEIMKLANDHELMVIEDSAQAPGASYRDKQVGTFGVAAAFSFYPGKNLGAYGDAGAIVTNETELAEKLRMIANHGQKEKHNHQIEGRNSRLDSIQAAILSVKLKYLADWNQLRKKHSATYNSLLQSVSIQLPVCPDYSRHVYHLFVVQVNDRDQVQTSLKQRGISTGLHYPTPLPYLPAYTDDHYGPQDFPVANGQKDRILSLPMYPELSEDQIRYVCDQIKNHLVG